MSGKKKRASNADPTEDEALEARKKRKIDEEIRRGVEEHTVSCRNCICFVFVSDVGEPQRKVRGSTLIDLHSKTSKKDEEDEKPMGIWDHGRDMSLGGRLMDDSTRNKMLRDARGLGDRFGTGTSGGFL